MMNAVDVIRMQVETTRGRLVEGAADLGEAIRPLWNDCLKAIDAAIRSIEPARTKVHRLWARKDFTIPAKQEQSTAIVRDLNDSVRTQLDKADRLFSEIAYKLEADVRPARPENASDMAVFHRKEEVAAYLRRIPGSGEVLNAVTQLLGEAIQFHDDLTAYVLAAGPLDWTYRELGVDRRRLRSALFMAVREAQLQPIAGEALLRAYEANHEDPASWQSLRRDIESMVGTVGSDAAMGLHLTAKYSPGWGVPEDGQPRRVESPDTTIGVKSPEAENLRQRMGSAVPADLKQSLDLNAAK